MKKIVLLVLTVFCFTQLSFAQETYVNESAKMPAHPRLFLQKGAEKALLQKIKKDAIWTEIHNIIIKEADDLINKPCLEQIVEGRRLVVHENVVRRVIMLSYAFRMTGNTKYLKRAEKELLNGAAFTNWNPTHFLDVAGMTTAMSIGYDWLYPYLSAETKQILETAIIEKGLKQSLIKDYNFFLDLEQNWNQVCNAAMTFGAVTIWEKDPKLASYIVNRAIKTLPLCMKHYAPEGAYPEGAGYWTFGTTYNVLFLDVMNQVFHSDFGLSETPGFINSGKFVLNMITPALHYFAFSDNGRDATFQPTLLWFYNRTKDPTILYQQKELYQKGGKNCIINDRFPPMILIWGANTSLMNPQVPKELNWKADGDNPVCAMRSSWTDPNANYLAMKMGSPSVNHGHMDVGSFVYENDGIQWAIDMGGENYHNMEVRGLDLWNMEQNSQRWTVYRYNNFTHNTLTFNHKYQWIDGKGELTDYFERGNQSTVVSDLTTIYKGLEVKSVKRAVSLVEKKYAVIEDQIETTTLYNLTTWTLVTPAKVTILSDHVALLEKDGKKVYVKVDCPVETKWKVAPAEDTLYPFNSPNPGISVLSFDAELTRSATQTMKVYLIPEENKDIAYQSAFK